MMLLGGVQDVHAVAAKAEGIVDRLVAFVDHIWHELEHGGPMVWVAFGVVFFAVVIVVGVWRGSITWKRGGST